MQKDLLIDLIIISPPPSKFFQSFSWERSATPRFTQCVSYLRVGKSIAMIWEAKGKKNQ